MAREICHYVNQFCFKDAHGSTLAPCGAVVSSVNPGMLGGAREELSTTILRHVTCPLCQQRLAAIGKLYCQARRVKEISW